MATTPTAEPQRAAAAAAAVAGEVGAERERKIENFLNSKENYNIKPKESILPVCVVNQRKKKEHLMIQGGGSAERGRKREKEKKKRKSFFFFSLEGIKILHFLFSLLF